MLLKVSQNKCQAGFIAVIAVVLLSATALAFSLVSTASAYAYFDMVSQKEIRIQARLNAESCLFVLYTLAYKNASLQGQVQVHDLGCLAEITFHSGSDIHGKVQSQLSGVTAVINF